MADFTRTHEKDALGSIKKGIILPESAPKPISTHNQTNVKKSDHKLILETNSNSSQPNIRKITKDDRPPSSIDGNSSNTETINEIPTRDRPK